jgi:Family of unknown function (DUF6502)
MLVRPVVSLMLRCGVTWKELADVLRLVYVDVATDDYGKHGRPANISRVAILTGMSRRDVRRARDLLAQDPKAAFGALERLSRATRVLSGWYQDPDFHDSQGRPKLLSRGGPGGFAALLKRYAPDLPPTAMLKELKHVGAVHETPTGRLRATSRSFIPAALDPDTLIRAGQVIGDLARTITHNLTELDKAARFERRATNLRVKRASRRAFDRYVESRGMEFLEDVDAWLSDHESSDADGRPVRLGVGVYLISD